MPTIKNSKILIDSNILIYCAEKELATGVKKLLRELEDNKNLLATSHASCFEILRNSDANSPTRKYFITLINYLDKIAIESDAIDNAFLLHELYKRKNPSWAKKGTIDLFIGGTCMLENALLLTANRKDFPAPFWEMRAQCHVIGKDNGGEADKLINIFLLEFSKESVPEDIKSVTIDEEASVRNASNEMF